MINPEILEKLTEVPYLLAFIIFAIVLFKYFQKWSDKKDQFHIERMEKSEAAWREFLVEQRTDFLNSIADITSAISEMKRKQEEHTALLEKHDKKLDLALARMDEKLSDQDVKLIPKRK